MLISFGRIAEVFTPGLLCQELGEVAKSGHTHLHLSTTWVKQAGESMSQ